MSISTEQELSIWRTINATRSIDGLVRALKDIGHIEISGDRGAYDMSERVMRVYENGEPINLLTRNYGVRQQYLYLVGRES